MLNYEVFAKNPINYHLPNDGVASGTEPVKEEEWLVLRQELQTFICDGEYRIGIERILSSFLQAFDNSQEGTQQKAVWVSGFYGSGKSHFVRVLKFLWANNALPDGAEPRSLVPNLPTEIHDLFTELNTRAKPNGGLFSVIGTLNKGAKGSARLAFLGIVFAAAKLPVTLAPARFVLWLRRNGYEESVRALVAAQKRDWNLEILDMHSSPVLAEAVLSACPSFAEDSTKALDALSTRFPSREDITDDEFHAILQEVLGGESNVAGKIPLTLLVIDELQQYIGDDMARMLDVQDVVETCSKRFGRSLMIVATGQSAMGGTPLLKKLQGRFTLPVQLSDADSLRVVREVVLRKKEDKKEDVAQTLEKRAGEIDRHLAGSKIAADASDRPHWVADYPILPARRRFWETALRSVDRSGGAAQLRTQLKAVHEAVRTYAERPLGHVVGADVLFDQLRQEMLQNGALQNDTDHVISQQERIESADPKLRARILKTTFLLNQIPSDYGLLATPDVLGDLLVEDLSNATTLRQQIPAALAALTQTGQLLEVGGQYRVQTRESAAWTADFRAAENRIKGEQGRLASDRATELKNAFSKAAGATRILHGTCKQPRELQFHFGDNAPANTGGIPIWVRDGWSTTEKTAREEAIALGMDSPVVHVFLPGRETESLKDALASLAAAEEVLASRGHPATPEGQEAKSGMENHRDSARRRIDTLLQLVLRETSIFLSGGGEVIGDGLRNTLIQAAEKSLVRLYPRFEEGDHARWGDVVKRIREGGSDAFKKADHDGEPDKHPVCAAVLAFVGAGKKGAEIRKHFAASPYGWPQDANDAALLGLTATQHLSAARNGMATPATKISGGDIGQTEFKREQITLTLGQKVALKKTLSDLNIRLNGEDLPGACQQLVLQLEALAKSAGGPPPAPVAPSLHHLDELKSLSGNALALAVWEKREALTADWQKWSEQADRIASRFDRWQQLETLLPHAVELPQGKAVTVQRDAMVTHRSLLDEPDPVPPLCLQLVEALRSAQQELRDNFNEVLERELAALQSRDVWKKLPPERATVLLQEHNLVSAPPLTLGSEAEVLAAIQSTPISMWRARITALSGATNAVLSDAIKECSPQAVRVHLSGGELKSETDVDEYLARVRSELMEHVNEGRPVIVL